MRLDRAKQLSRQSTPTFRRPERRAACRSKRRKNAVVRRGSLCAVRLTKARCPPCRRRPKSQRAPHSRAGNRCNGNRSTRSARRAIDSARSHTNNRPRSPVSFREHWMKLQTSGRLGQLHPAAATAVGFRIRKTPDRLQSKDPHKGDVHSRRVIVIETLPHHALSQDVQRFQRPHVSPLGHDARFFDPRKIANLNLVRPGLGQDRRGETDALQLFVKKGREKKNSRCWKAKPSRPSAIPPLRMMTLCRPSPSGPADQRPFLETDILHLAAPKLRSRRCPSRSTCTRIRSFPATASPAPRKTSPSAKAKGLHGFALTDHNTNDGVTYLLEKGLMREDGMPVDDFLIIPGRRSNDGGRSSALHRRLAPLSQRPAGARSLRSHP